MGEVEKGFSIESVQAFEVADWTVSRTDTAGRDERHTSSCTSVVVLYGRIAAFSDRTW